MSKKRLFLSAVIAVCACTIVYAIVRPREFLQDLGPADPEQAQSQDARRAEIRNFSMPHVSEAGVTEWIAKGERAVQTSANTYDVTKIVIEMFAGVNPDTGEQRVVRLTGDTGAINHSSRQAAGSLGSPPPFMPPCPFKASWKPARRQSSVSCRKPHRTAAYPASRKRPAACFSSG